jgi:hypothetical protein
MVLRFGLSSGYVSDTPSDNQPSKQPVNGYLGALAIKFYRDQTYDNAKGLFFGTIKYLPILFALMLLHKKKPEEKAKEREMQGKERGV